MNKHKMMHMPDKNGGAWNACRKDGMLCLVCKKIIILNGFLLVEKALQNVDDANSQFYSLDGEWEPMLFDPDWSSTRARH